MKQIEIGTVHSIELVLTEQQSAIVVGSGDVNVLGTPAMIAYMEKASVQLMQPFFEEHETSVGVHLEVDHTRATAIGDKVTFFAKLTNIEDNRKLFFDIWAEDEKGSIGKGTLQRFVIDRERFMAKLNK